MTKAWEVFDELCCTGNLVAQLKKAELQHLHTMLQGLSEPGADPSACLLPPPLADQLATETAVGSHKMSDIMRMPPNEPVSDSMAGTDLLLLHDFDLGADFGAQQLSDMADAIEVDHIERMAQTITEYDIW